MLALVITAKLRYDGILPIPPLEFSMRLVIAAALSLALYAPFSAAQASDDDAATMPAYGTFMKVCATSFDEVLTDRGTDTSSDEAKLTIVMICQCVSDRLPAQGQSLTTQRFERSIGECEVEGKRDPEMFAKKYISRFAEQSELEGESW